VPKQIDLLILTHTHIDHVGALADFPQAPVVIAAAERALPRPLYWGGLQPLDWPDRAYVVLEGDREIGPGFDRCCRRRVMRPASWRSWLRLPRTGPVLLTSDAISRPAEIDEGFDIAPDPAQRAARVPRG
jgi:N-acyl homoserine lactone hydrolase